MPKLRHKLIPARVKAELDALEATPPPEVFQRRLELRRRLSVALLCLLSTVLLTVSFAPFDCWYLAYVALVPWAMVLIGGKHTRWALLWGYLSGVLFWAANLYWLWWITLVGYAALVIYLSLYWLVAALILRAAMRRNWPMWIVLPVVWVALEYARAYVISGFPWFYLAHSQYAQLRLIQVSDLTGQYGVSFFVAMVNGACIDLFVSPLFIRSPRGARLRMRMVFGAAATCLMGAALFGYGTWRLGQQTRQDGPVIGIVQHAFPISLTGRSVSAEKILDSHLISSRKFIGAEADLVIWPETMLPKGLNPELLEQDLTKLSGEDLRVLTGKFYPLQASGEYSDELLRESMNRLIKSEQLADGTRRPGLLGYAAQVGALSRQLGCPILAGGATVHHNPKPAYPADRWVTRNSALWFDGTWKGSVRYSKVHLVPFSEYVPFKRSWAWLHHHLEWFVPPVMQQLDPGSSYTHFELRRNGRMWRLGSPICYEGTFGRICRRMVIKEGRKAVDILANISNDGWFVWRVDEGPYRGSTEHTQHLVQYCFRAVENRVPVVRSVNTGISASIDSDGRIVAVLHQYGARTMVTGTLLLDGLRRNTGQYAPGHGPKILVDRRVSMYSLVGDIFAMVVSLAAAAMTVKLLMAGISAKKKTTER